MSASQLKVPSEASSHSSKAVMEALKVTNKGLTTADAADRLAHFGPNELPEVPPTPFWKLVLEQFDDGLVRILLVAAAVSFAMALLEGDQHGFVEPFVILLILILNAAVGVWQENKAESAIDALKSFVPKTATVVRDGTHVHLAAEHLVPGDIVEVAVGNRVPADMRVLELLSTTLRADQSILNGESVEVLKHADTISGRHERFPSNMVYSGTAIVYGKARCVVIRTGTSTEIGSIERDVREQEDVKTPLQLKLDEFGELLSKVIGWICLAVFVINLGRWFYAHRGTDTTGKQWWELYLAPVVNCLQVAVALAVAAIPEGLPAVVTTCLALGTRKMAQHNAIVRSLPSVETLGRCTVICSDKTGTLTTNMMSVLQAFTVGTTSSKGGVVPLRRYTLDDSKYNVVCNTVKENGHLVHRPLAGDSALSVMASIAVMCNDASLTVNAKTGQVEKVGEATEAALLTFAEKMHAEESGNIHKFRDETSEQWKKNTTLEFTRKRKSMGVHCTSSNGKIHNLFVKGAPEAVLSRCTRILLNNGDIVPLSSTLRDAVEKEVSVMSGNELALRCIGFAFKAVADASKLDLSDPDKFEKVESEMTFVGTLGMIDPPRGEVREAIAKCRTAGIRVIVITGDNKETAEAICRKIGLLSEDAPEKDVSFTGHEFSEMSAEQKRQAIRTAKLFSRTDPSHKMALVQLLQDERLICAMTGDGVNDAPALKKADIGIAMGSGTEVAKAASNMVLADDNFATVVKAVREGRAIYNNTKQFIRYLISSNIGEVVCILITGLVGLPDALAPVQLLWVNLVTDGLPATALGFNSPDPDIMEQEPRRLDEPIVNGWLFFRYMIVGTYVGLATVGGFLWWFLAHGFTWYELMNFNECTTTDKCAILENPETARAIALSILVVVEMFNALNALSENQSIVVVRPSTNKYLLVAIASSMFLHFAIMYVPALAATFAIAPLGVPPHVVKSAAPWSILIPEDFSDWKAVLVFSVPVLFIDEGLKLASRMLKQH